MKLIKFSKDNCHGCKKLKPELEEAIEELEIKSETVDVEDDLEKTREYGVRAAPTTVLEDDEGEELGRFMGAKTKDEIIGWVHTQ